MKVSLNVDEDQKRRIEEVMRKTGIKTKSDLFNYAFAMIDWAVEEASQGRTFGSFDVNAKTIRQLEMPPLKNARDKAKSDEGRA